MTLREAIAVCKDMQEWRRYDGDRPKLMPWTPKKFGEAIDVLIDLAERQGEMENDIRRFKDNLNKATGGGIDMTIEERAIAYQGKLASSFLGFPDLLEGGLNGYIVGATEQKSIDDVKVSEIYEWIDKHAIVIEGLNGAFVNAYELKDIINNITGE